MLRLTACPEYFLPFDGCYHLALRLWELWHPLTSPLRVIPTKRALRKRAASGMPPGDVSAYELCALGMIGRYIVGRTGILSIFCAFAVLMTNSSWAHPIMSCRNAQSSEWKRLLVEYTECQMKCDNAQTSCKEDCIILGHQSRILSCYDTCSDTYDSCLRTCR